MQRLIRWLEQFKRCFGHRAQLLSLRTYVQGVFSDSERKSMQAMLARVTEPVAYQAFQHFITHAPWDADRVWRRLRAVIPERRGMLILDGTSFPKQGPDSVGAARQYLWGAGQDCQLPSRHDGGAVDRAARLVSGRDVVSARRVADAGAPAAGADSGRRPLPREVAACAHPAPASPRGRLRADGRRRRCGIWRCDRRCAPRCIAGVCRTRSGFRRISRCLSRDRAWSRRCGAGARGPAAAWSATPCRVHEVARQWPRSAWRSISWRNGTQPRRRARFAALRVTPAQGRRTGPLAPEVWLLCEREAGPATRLKYYFVHLPATASLRTLVVLAHQRWAIEQQYQELKTELGLDHFEGRSYPGWQHHVVLTAVAHAYIQCERRRRGATTLTFPAVRAIVQEIFTALLFAAKPRYMQWMEQAKRNLQLRI